MAFEAEACYEKHPQKHKFEFGIFEAWHVRRRAYWSVLAGSLGYTYGANGIRQMSKKGRDDITKFNYYWHEALGFQGAGEMIHLKELFESPNLSASERIPDKSLIIDQPDSVDFYVQNEGKDLRGVVVYSERWADLFCQKLNHFAASSCQWEPIADFQSSWRPF